MSEGFFSSIVSFFTGTVNSIAGGVSETVSSVVEGIESGLGYSNSNTHSLSYDGDVYFDLKFAPPDFDLDFRNAQLEGIIDIYGQEGVLIDLEGKTIKFGDPNSNALARRFAHIYLKFLNSPEGKAFVKEFGRPDYRYFAVGNFNYGPLAVTYPQIHLVAINRKYFHHLLVDPSNIEALRIFSHEAIHQLGDFDEFNTYSKNEAFLLKCAKEAERKGDKGRASRLKKAADIERKVRDANYGSGKHAHAVVEESGLERLLAAA